jgi:hypothetical protein
MPHATRWAALLCAVLWIGFGPHHARAHELGIDQLVLWPDRKAGTLRGEITFDPELTRARETIPGEKDEARVRTFLSEQLRIEVDDAALGIDFAVRELWVAGGAVPGDIAVFTAALSPEARHLRVHAGAVIPALVVSIENPLPDGHAEAWSWLLRGDEWTPRYALGAAPEARNGSWQRGGAELFDSTERVNQHGVKFRTEQPTAVPAEPEPGLGTLAWRFVVLGFDHILPKGIDHLLFVAGVVLGSVRNLRQILLALTSFTLAHTLTLGLSQTSWLCAPPQIVEPVIALSICLVGVDNLRRKPEAQAHWRRYAVIFAFGLVHGLGFGTALAELSFQREQLLVALLSFNVGVELGQVTFVMLLLFALHRFENTRTLERFVVVPGSYAIIAAGLAFAVTRVFG